MEFIRYSGVRVVWAAERLRLELGLFDMGLENIGAFIIWENWFFFFHYDY